ncbi:hypothetical protein GCM10023258_17980 [Terrabacter aeriphilus]|uniref:Secreted protein n=1 Tax=Terrabacter aeriphilus TaxID=515662 RepID=A0ABP9JB65_9MICO
MNRNSTASRGRRALAAATLATTMALGGAAVAASPAAQAEPAGQYYYECIGVNGSSYFLQKGALLSSCKGSYLKKYINGNLVKTMRLTGYGTPAKNVTISFGCFVALVGAGSLIIGTDGLSTLVVIDAAVAGYGFASACKA